MSRTIAMLGAVVAGLVWTPALSAQDARAVIDAAWRAMGVEALRTVQYTATGYDFVLGQSGAPGAPWPRFRNPSYTRSVNFETAASRVERVRVQGEDPPFGGGLQPLPGEQAQTQTIVIGAPTPWVQQLEIWMLPHGFLRAADARGATLERQGDYSVLSFQGDNGAPVRGFIDAQNRVARVETMIDNPVMGDIPFEALYSDYRMVQGFQFPMRIVQRQGGFLILDLTLGEVRVNPTVDIQVAQGGRGGGAGGGAAGGGGGPGGTAAIPSEELAPGIRVFAGGYAMIAVDMGDHIVMFESGNSEARAQAVIAEAKRIMPGKPIRYVVNTHHHFDHAGGLRAFIAEGATILTSEWNKPYLQQILSRPRTLSPDAQERARRPVNVEGVGDRHVLSGNGKTIELHRMTDFGHTPGMLVAYFPQLRILYEADMYNPGPLDGPLLNPPSLYNIALLENIERLNLAVDRILPVHLPADGRVVTVAELRRIVGRN